MQAPAVADVTEPELARWLFRHPPARRDLLATLDGREQIGFNFAFRGPTAAPASEGHAGRRSIGCG